MISTPTFLRAQRRPGAVTAAMLCMGSTFANAQTASDGDLLLNEVVVSAAGYEQKITDAPASISVVTQEELKRKPYSSLVDAVSDLEGVDVGETSDKTGQRTISIRGMGSDNTLVLINGRRQSNHGDIYPNSFQGNQYNHLPPLDAVERIEVIRGPASTLYGADAMGGVINIITKKVTDEWHGSATIGRTMQQQSEYGDASSLDFDLRGPVVKNLLGINLRGSFYDKDASNPEYAPAVDPNGVVHERTVGFGGGGRLVKNTNRALGMSLSLTPDARQSITVDWDISRQKYDNSQSQLGTLDSPSTIWRAGGGMVQPRVGYTAEQRFTRDSWAITHEGDWDFGRSSVSLGYVDTKNKGRTLPFSTDERRLLQQMWDGTGDYAGLSQNERRDMAAATFLPRAARNLESNQYTLDAKLDIPLKDLAGDHMLIVGAQIISGELRDGVFGLENGQAGGKQDQKTQSIFMEDNWMITDQFTLTSGLRYDHHNTFGSHLSPRLYGVYNLNPEWTVKGGISTGYKTPLTTDLYDGITGFGGQGVTPFAGNPDLKPETSVNSELAVYWSSPQRHSFNATVFHNNFKDKIASGTATQTCAATGGVRPCVNFGEYEGFGYETYSQKINIDKAVIQGLELAGRYQFNPTIGVRGNLTYTDSEQKTGPRAGYPLTNLSKYMANISVDWQAMPKLNTFLTTEYRSKRYRGFDSATGAELYWKGFTQLHAGASYEINKNFSITGRINNLLDRDFTSYRTLFAPDGNGGYEASFQDDYNNKDARRSFWISINARF